MLLARIGYDASFMSWESAAYWLDAIALGGIAIWMVGVWFVMQTRNRCLAPIEGEFEVAATPERIGEHLVRVLAQSHRGSLLAGSTIDQATASEVQWHREWMRQSGWVRMTARGGRSNVSYGLELGTGMLKWAWVVVALGAATIAGLYLILAEHAVPSESSGVRGQVIQMVQCVHLLWPPFLLGGIARQRRRLLRSELERTLKHAPFRETN